MKTKYTLYNSISGIILYSISIIFGLASRRVLVLTLGIEYQGINGLFSNIISMLSIAELGIGSAIIYHLYEPLVKNNVDEVRALMNFYKKCYLMIAGIVGLIGVCLIPFLKFIIVDSNIHLSITLLYSLYLVDAICSYLFTYKRSILIADQRNYIVTFCDILYQVTTKLLQMGVLLITNNFILYLGVMILCRLSENILINFISVKRYPFLKEKTHTKLSQRILIDIKLKVKGAFFHKIGAFVVFGTDNILISRFFGLTTVGIYSNYQLVVSALSNISAQLCSSATASIGHLLVEKNKYKSFIVFQQMQLINGYIAVLTTTGLFCVANQLIALIFGSQFVLDDKILLIISLNFYLTSMRRVYSVFKESAGILYEDRYIPILESILNLVSSLILLHLFGLIGVFLGTILSNILLFIYTYPILVYKRIFDGRILKYYMQFFHIFIIALFSLILSKLFINLISIDNIILQIISNCFISIICSLCLFYMLYARNTEELRLLLARCKGWLK